MNSSPEEGTGCTASEAARSGICACQVLRIAEAAASGNRGRFAFRTSHSAALVAIRHGAGHIKTCLILSLRSAKQNKISDALNVIADFMVLSRAPELSR
jgi:hypothetical protein